MTGRIVQPQAFGRVFFDQQEAAVALDHRGHGGRPRFDRGDGLLTTSSGKHGDDVVSAFDQRGAISEQAIAARTARYRGDPSFHHLGRSRRVQRTRARAGFDHHDDIGEGRDHVVAPHEVPWQRLRAAGKHTNQRATGCYDLFEQCVVLFWIDDIDACSKHRNRVAACIERTAMGRGIDAIRTARDDRRATRRQLSG